MSDDRHARRQEIYDRIRASSKDALILEEMIRLGFWPQEGTLPQDPGDEIRRETELRQKLRALGTESSRLHNVEALRKAAYKLRLAEARQKREETKQRREQQRQERARAWALKRTREIQHLGLGVSSDLGKRQGNRFSLDAAALPRVNTAADIAEAMQISVAELRWLAFHRTVSATTHYRRFSIPKKTGGERVISAPMPRLKHAQRWVLKSVLERVPLHPAAHGFVSGRSILTNARPHLGAQVLVNMDLQNFFPTVTYPRVKGLFRQLGYSPEASTIFGLLCTEPLVAKVELDGRTWYVHRSQRHLPQGSPASPAITNVMCRRMDGRLQGLSKVLGFTYTRYADDVSFSSADRDAQVGTLIRAVGDIVADEGFVVHPDKTRVMRQGRRMEVTGLVVNDRLGVPRDVLRRFRATVFQVERDGPEGKHWGGGKDLFAAMLGFAAFIVMVDPRQGQPLLDRVRAAASANGYKPKYRSRKRWNPLLSASKQGVNSGKSGLKVKTRRSDKGTTSPSADDEASWVDELPTKVGVHVVGGVKVTRSGGDPVGEAEEPKAPSKKKWWEFWKK